ncbi:nucleoside triphosphate hydrolase, partial [Yersinia pestis]
MTLNRPDITQRNSVTQKNSLHVVTQEILLEPADNQRLLSLCV